MTFRTLCYQFCHKLHQGHVKIEPVCPLYFTTRQNKMYQVCNTVCYFPSADVFAVLGTSQDATEHLHHHSQTIAFVPS